MRTLTLAAAVMLLLGGRALAADDDGSHWISPGYEALKSRWPHDASGALSYGRVILECAVGPKGFATDCKVKSSQPKNATLETAALAVAPLFKARDGQILRADVDVDMRFDQSPRWARKPTLDEFMSVFPREAGSRGESGSAVIRCTIQTNGLLRGCSLVREEKTGLGFGPAALVLSRTFLFTPAIKGGQPVETEITIPVNFKSNGPMGGAGSKNVMMMSAAVWSKTPSMSEILAEIDKKVGDKFADGQVAFQCDLSRNTGKLSNCTVANYSPGMTQFQGVARALIPKFRADPEDLKSIKDDIRINLAFAFPDMQSPAWGKRYLAHPQWVQRVSPNPDQGLFPEQAGEAGLKTGSATVDCVLASSGALTHCTTVSESTPGVGFGEMAQKIAEVFVANPWTEDGLPAEGAHVRLPVKMTYDPTLAGSPTPATTPAASPGSPPPSR